MAKFYGSMVKTGRVGGSVFSVRYGETIERQYQPNVANPSTEAQVAARAKLKLMSQMSAVMAPVIAMPRIGAQSVRNRFVSENYPLADYTNDTASVTLASIKLTKSVVGLPQVNASRSENTIGVNLTVSAITVDVSRVVYTLFEVQGDGKLRYVTSSVVSDGGTNNTYPTTFPLLSSPVVIYAYGVRDNSENARAIFGNMEVPTASAVANLIVSRQLTETDVTLTETRGILLPIE